MPKKSLRASLLARRRAMDAAEWQASSSAAQQRLMGLQQFQQAVCVALYAPVQQEVATELLFSAALAAGKVVLFPKVCGDNLQFVRLTSPAELVSGAFGIPEPSCTAETQLLNSADLIVVPGVAFDLHGHRLGFGKGFYDRCLSRTAHHGTHVGLCHDFQLLDRIPAEGHDIRMQYLVTATRVIAVGTGPGAGLI